MPPLGRAHDDTDSILAPNTQDAELGIVLRMGAEARKRNVDASFFLLEVQDYGSIEHESWCKLFQSASSRRIFFSATRKNSSSPQRDGLGATYKPIGYAATTISHSAVYRATLSAGRYRILPFSTGARLRKRSSQPGVKPVGCNYHVAALVVMPAHCRLGQHPRRHVTLPLSPSPLLCTAIEHQEAKGGVRFFERGAKCADPHLRRV